MSTNNDFDINKKTILVVDDDAFHSHIVSDMLKNDYNIIIANNGLEALISLNKVSHIDLMLLDMVMPVLNGYGVLQYIRELSSNKVPHIILTTNVRQEHLQVDEYKDIIDDVVYKPFDQELLSIVIKKVLKK